MKPHQMWGEMLVALHHAVWVAVVIVVVHLDAEVEDVVVVVEAN